MKSNKYFKKIVATLLLSCLMIFAWDTLFSQIMVDKPVIEFAKKSLSNYINDMMTEKNITRFGFKTLKEAQAAQLGDPLQVMMIGLKDLKEYRDGKIKPILIDTKTLWFPVISNGETKVKLEIIERDGKWIAGEFGNVRTTQVTASVLRQLPKLLEDKGIKVPYKIIFLKIPVLASVFLYVESTTEEYLIPALSQPKRYNLENGKIYDAKEVLSRLKDASLKIDEKKLM